MSDPAPQSVPPAPVAPAAPPVPGPLVRGLERLGRPTVRFVEYAGGVSWMLADVVRWIWRSVVLRRVRLGWPAIYVQIVRVGVRSVGVIALVSICIGLILVLQMAPRLQEFGQTDKVANLVGVSVFRELGPLLSAIVLTGFAGASITAELGTMVVGEEVEALEAHALNPIRFLVVPRVLATVVSLIMLSVLGDLVAVTAGGVIGVGLLDIPAALYIHNTIHQLVLADFFTGLFKAAAFGGIMGSIACYNGLAVNGGAAGVGRATTNTVVHSILCIICTDLLFTAIFYKIGWT